MGERLIPYMLAFCLGFMLCHSTAAEASIVNDPVALELKLEEMRVARMAKHERREQYWAEYRKLPGKMVPKKRCSKVYSSNGGVRTNCRYELVEVKDDSAIRHLLRR